MRKLVSFSGSFSNPSKTSALVEAMGEEVIDKYDVSLLQYSIADLGGDLGRAFRVGDLGERGQEIVDQIAAADALIIGTPVYKGSYPGLFKHFIDLLDPNILYGKPILLAASGGGHRHALMVEHQLRPLFGFFQAHSLPTAIYASSEDFNSDNKIISESLNTRIAQGVAEFAPFLKVPKLNAIERYFQPDTLGSQIITEG